METTEASSLNINVQPLILSKSNEETTLDRKYDISNFLGKKIDNAAKVDVLENVCVPSITFNFPYTADMNKNRKFRYDWLHQHNWLCYSVKLDGAFCKFCVLFAPKEAGIGSQKLGTFSVKPYRNWKKALQAFHEHENKIYHKNAVCNSHEVVQDINGKKVPVDILLNSEKHRQIEENRKKLIPIIDAVIVCGRQDIALRGHRYHGKFQVDLSNEPGNTGNFRTILAYRARGDNELKEMLEGPGERNKYISPGIQNDIIDACNQAIIEDIVQRVNKAKAFSILADETADIAGIEQLSLGVKYFDSEERIVREYFLKFVPVTDLTGRGLASTITNQLKTLGIDMQYLRGQGYDGAASMSGYLNGVQVIINQDYKMAPYVHCMGHVFNLVVSDACTVPAIRNALGTVQEIRNFFVSPKRKAVLNEYIAKADARAQSLKRLCQTRWIERFHAVEDFVELLGPILDSLTTIKKWSEKNTAREASALANSIVSGEFLVAIKIAQHLFSYGLPLSKYLQKANIDLKAALNHAETLSDVLKVMRSSATAEFHVIFEEAMTIAKQHNVEIGLPRLFDRQCHRENPAANNPEEYFRISTFIPFLDAFIVTLKERFTSHRNLFLGFSDLLPLTVEALGKWTDHLDRLLEFYREDDILQGDSAIQAEFRLWHQILQSEYNSNKTPLPSSGVDAILRCEETFFPNIFRLLQFLATLPVSTATSERSFSTLKRVKTYLRNSIGQNRLNGLAALSIHREQEVNISRILDILARQKNRRTQLLL